MPFHSNYLWVNGIRTHYLEAGDSKEVLVLLHSAEFSASAEFSWENNIEVLASKFHVYCPDLVGFGKSGKVFDFENSNDFKLKQLRALLETLGIRRAHFGGNSWSANLLLGLASQHSNLFEFDRIIAISAGYGTNTEVRKAMTEYALTKDSMQKILKILFLNEKWYTDPYLERRYVATLEPGSWEAVAAARFAPPGKEKGWKGVGAATDYSKIDNKVLLVGGEKDELAPPVAVRGVHELLRASEVHVLQNSKHCPHIEQSAEFNKVALAFLSSS
jgi:2-hydroxymuconate-semialdehyde hydrolase